MHNTNSTTVPLANTRVTKEKLNTDFNTIISFQASDDSSHLLMTLNKYKKGSCKDRAQQKLEQTRKSQKHIGFVQKFPHNMYDVNHECF